ncbi:PDZ domain-containing protein [Aestuariibacter halophilus]|uniref:PDZ domain-containing protein n=1 Tax=Fluctibacter halophilus TaxID=226011 RepID=A0ABS8G755_9ALTE|nr:PDZ domain-containing protein [Aestuariibacter halophilus]MCC2616248.1 PDZ domain-containing protein [Aestuariibacter halophilus]
MMKTAVLVLTALLPVLLTSTTAHSQTSDDTQDRRARWHATFEPATPTGRTVTSLMPESGLTQAGMAVGDILLAVDGEVIRNGDQWWDITYNLRADTPVSLTYKRGTTLHDATIRFAPVEKEHYENLQVEYGFLRSDYNLRQRYIITLPKQPIPQPQPAIFVVGGLSCSSIEILPGRTSNFIRTLRDLVIGSGMLVMRIEKPGVGDSEGRCSETDFTTELNGYEVALKQLLADPRVDRQRVIVFGSSMGSALAPYLANKYALNGIIADGTFYRSWFEHMLEIERRILAMQGNDQATISAKMNQAYIPLYYKMLINKQTYAEIIDENPLLATYNYHGADTMYGRPMAFYHQMQDFDVAGAWSQVSIPTRIRWGTNDWIMSEYDIDMLHHELSQKQGLDVQVEKFDGMDHWYTIHDSPATSFLGQPGQWDERISQQLIDWAKQLNKQTNPRWSSD